MDNNTAKQFFRLIHSYQRDSMGVIIRAADSAASRVAEDVFTSIQRERRRHDRKVISGFVATAALIVGASVYNHVENEKIERYALAIGDNNVLITPNGKDYYTVDSYERDGCERFEVHASDWSKGPDKPVVIFTLPEQKCGH